MAFAFSQCEWTLIYYYRPQRSCDQGYVFTRVCDSVNRGGSLGRLPLGPGRHPPDQADTPPRPGRHPPGTRQTPPCTRQTPPGPGRHPPGPGRHPPRPGRHPPDQADTPQTRQTPPPREEDCSIRSMSGRYASYWNAFLYCRSVLRKCRSSRTFCAGTWRKRAFPPSHPFSLLSLQPSRSVLLRFPLVRSLHPNHSAKLLSVIQRNLLVQNRRLYLTPKLA